MFGAVWKVLSITTKTTSTLEQCLKLGVTAHREIAVVERINKRLLGFIMVFGFCSLHLGKMSSLNPHH